jgi:uroporphyrinogen-III synthase
MIELRPLEIDADRLKREGGIVGDEPVIITSAHAADIWLGLRRTTFRQPDPRGYYVVGETGGAKLRESDPHVPVLAVASSADELLMGDFDGARRLLYPCSGQRRDMLVDRLRERGIEVAELPLYAPGRPESSQKWAEEALRRAAVAPPLILCFFSPSAVRNFLSLPLEIPEGAIFAAIGPTTADALREEGVADILMAAEPRAGALAEMLAKQPGISN